MSRDMFQQELASYANLLEASSLEFQGLQIKIARYECPYPDDCRQLYPLLCTIAVFVQRLSTLLTDPSKLPAEVIPLRELLLMALQNTERQGALLFPLVGQFINRGRLTDWRDKQEMKYHLALFAQHYAEVQVQYDALRERVSHQERQHAWSMLVADSEEAKQRRETVATFFDFLKTSLQTLRSALRGSAGVGIEEHEKLQAIIDQFQEPLRKLTECMEAIPWIKTSLEEVRYELMHSHRWLIIARDIQRGWKTARKQAQYFPLKSHDDYYQCIDNASKCCEAALSLLVQQVQPLASWGEQAPGLEEGAQ